MAPTELLKPRYEVIADYPGSPFEIGEVLQTNIYCAGQDMTGSGVLSSPVYKPEKYPAIFRPLDWWEHRKPEEWPQYVKWRDLVGKAGGTEKEFEMHLPNGNSTVMHIDNYTPATETEYNEYLKTKV
jgi:hypothetical protein